MMILVSKPDDQGNYGFHDLSDGQAESIHLTPDVSPVRIVPLDPGGRPLIVRLFNQELHEGKTTGIFAPNVIEVPPSGVRLEFFTPLIGINVHVASDIIDNARRCGMRVYAENGDYIGGDRASAPFGPVPDPNNMPDGMDPNTTDFQYMVWSMPAPLPPPYSNPIHGRPAMWADFFPDGPGVYIGRVVPRS